MRGEPFVVDNLGGGVNRENHPYSLDQTQAKDALNVEAGALPGGVKKRNGFGHLASPGKTVHSLASISVTGFNGLVGIGDNGSTTDIYKIATDGTVTSIKGGATVSLTDRWVMLQLPVSGSQGPLYMMNGTDTPLQWDGAAGSVGSWTASDGTLPNGKYMVYHDNRVLVAGTDTYSGLTNEVARASVYASKIIDPRDWSTPNGWRTILDPEDGERITALGKVGSYALAFKPRKTYSIYNSDTGAYRRISDTIGCIAPKSVVETERGTLFLTKNNGVMITNGTEIQSVDRGIRKLLEEIPGDSIKNASAVYHDRNYYLSFDTDGNGNNYIAQYEVEYDRWWIHTIYMDSSTTTGVNDWAILNPSTTQTLYAAGADMDAPRVWEAFKANTYQDRDGDGSNEANFLHKWESAWQVFGEPHRRKILRQIRADASGEYSVYTARSFASAGFYSPQETVVWEQAEGETGGEFGGEGNYGGSGTFGGGGPLVQERRFYTPGTARAWAIKFEGQNASPFELYAYTLAVDVRSD